MVHIKRLRVVFEDHVKKTGGKWTYILLYIISKYPVRFNKIRQLLPDITARTLSLALEKMHTNGLIYKDLEVYKITPLGTLTLESVFSYIEKAKELENK
jgi:DNA-binding HxlR family transcriptional regulator